MYMHMISAAFALTTCCVNLAIFLRRNCGGEFFLSQSTANRIPDHNLGLPPPEAGESPNMYVHPGYVRNWIGPMAPVLAAVSSIAVSSKGMSTHNSWSKRLPMWACQRMRLTSADCCIACREARHAPPRLRVMAWSTLRRLRVGC